MILHWDIDPVLVNLFGIFPIHYYSLLFLSGLLLGYEVVKRQNQKSLQPIPEIEQLFLYIIVGTVVGARLGHCLFYEPSYFLQHPLEMILPFRWSSEGFEWTGFRGLASHGGAIGVLSAIGLFCYQQNVKFLAILDKVALGVPLAGTFIRLGNFMNAEIIGKATNANYGIVFERVDQLPRHPSQLYEALAYLIIFIFLYRISRKWETEKKTGVLFGLFLILLFTARFILEFTKIDQVDFEADWWLNMGQFLSVPFILMGMVLVFRNRYLAKTPG